MAAGWKPPQDPTTEVARKIAEEILVKVEQHGFRPLQPDPDDGPGGERFSSQSLCVSFVVKNELRWYRGARRPHQDAGVIV
jgi:hypothetical protein